MPSIIFKVQTILYNCNVDSDFYCNFIPVVMKQISQSWRTNLPTVLIRGTQEFLLLLQKQCQLCETRIQFREVSHPEPKP